MGWITGGGYSPDNTTIGINSSALLQVEPSSITETQGSGVGVTYSTNTTLTADVYANNVTINTGVTVTTNGYNFYCAGNFTNNGTISTGYNSLGATGQIQNGGSASSSYGGSGAGSGRDVGDGNGGATGGSTLAGGGSAGSSGTHNGGNGGTPSSPTLNVSNIQSWYTAGWQTYLQGAGGATSNGLGGETAGNGAYGIYIQAVNVTAGTINAYGQNATTTGSDLGGCGGGGGGSVIIAYKTTYTSGTVNVIGGGGEISSGNGNGGTGGNGQSATYQWTTMPIGLNNFPTISNSSSGVNIFNLNVAYASQSTTSTSPVTASSVAISATTTGYMKVQAVVRIASGTLTDGVAVYLYRGTTLLDSVSYTQEGLSNNLASYTLFATDSIALNSQTTYTVQYAAVTGGTATIQIQEFSVSEVY